MSLNFFTFLIQIFKFLNHIESEENTFKILASFIIKGIVSRDWGRLQMGSLDRSEFRVIPLEVYF
jgi:hypothetical protein